jgi:hypothetical protein
MTLDAACPGTRLQACKVTINDYDYEKRRRKNTKCTLTMATCGLDTRASLRLTAPDPAVGWQPVGCDDSAPPAAGYPTQGSARMGSPTPARA